MKIKIYIERNNEEKYIDFDGKTIKDLCNYLNLSPSRFIIVKNDQIVTEDDEINENDYIKFLDAVSGG